MKKIIFIFIFISSFIFSHELLGQATWNYGTTNGGGPNNIFSANTGNVFIGVDNTSIAGILFNNKLNVFGTAFFSENVGIGTVYPKAKLDVEGNSYFRGKVGIGTASPATKLHVVGDGCILGNLGIGTTNPTSRLSVGGRVSIAPSGVPQENAYLGDLVLTKNSYSGQYINLIRNGSFPWSIGMVYNTSNFAIGQAQLDNTKFDNPFFVINYTGDVGIGYVWPQAKLDVAGDIRAYEVKVCMNGCDFVFEENYNLMGLDELNNFITKNKHLPEVAPAAVMEDEGVNMGELNSKLLQKIEELTLYVIGLNEEIKQLKAAK